MTSDSTDKFFLPSVGAVRTVSTPFIVPFACTLKKLCILQNVAGAGAGTEEYVVQINGVDTFLGLGGIGVTDTSTHTTSTDVSVNANDLIGIRAKSTGVVSTPPTFVYVTVEYTVP